MGTYCTLVAPLPCRRCGETYEAEVQFKTGDDREMAVYQVGDVVPGVRRRTYEGMASAYYPACERRWLLDVWRIHFELLAEDIAAGRMVARRKTDQHGVYDEAPLSADTVRTMGESPAYLFHGTFAAMLLHAGLGLWLGDVCLYPGGWPIGDAEDRWYDHHFAELAARLTGLGWPYGQHSDLDFEVVVDDEHRVRLASDRGTVPQYLPVDPS